MADPNTLLQQTYGFTPDDLETNRRAQLTADQQKIIDVGQEFIRESADRYSKTPTHIVIWLIVMLVLVAGAAYFLAGDAFKQLYQQLGSWALPVIAIIVMLIVLWLLYARRSAKESVEMFRAMGDPMVDKPTVHGIEGRVELVKEDVRSGAGNRRTRDIFDTSRVLYTNWYAQIRSSYETVKVGIPEKDRNPFEAQRTYRVFYVEHGGTRSFLSAEVVN